MKIENKILITVLAICIKQLSQFVILLTLIKNLDFDIFSNYIVLITLFYFYQVWTNFGMSYSYAKIFMNDKLVYNIDIATNIRIANLVLIIPFHFIFIIYFDLNWLHFTVLTLSLLLPIEIIKLVYESKSDIHRYKLIESILFLIFTPVKITSIIYSSIEYFIFLMALERVVLYGILRRLEFYKICYTKLEIPKLNAFKPLIPLAITTLVTSGYTKIDSLMISQLAVDSNLDSYFFYQRINDALLLLVFSLNSVLFREIFTASQFNLDPRDRKLRISLLVILCVSITSPIIIYYILNQLGFSQISEHILILLILNVSAPLIFVSICTSRFISATKYGANYILTRGLLGVLINVTLNFLVIPVYGIYGAALTSLFTQFYLSIIHDMFYPHFRRYLVWRLMALGLKK